MGKGAFRVFLELFGCSALALALGSAPLAVVIAVDRGCGPDEAIVPALMQVRRLLAGPPIIPALTGVTFALLAWRRAWPALSGSPRWKRLGVLGAGLVATAASLLGAMVLQIQLDPHWLFPPAIPKLRQPSPDGKRTAWAALDCFFVCRWTVYVQEQGAWRMKKVSSTPEAKEPPGGATLEWDAASREVRLHAGTPGS